MKYKIPVVWEMAGEYEIEAETLEEAVNQSYYLSLPDGEYIDDSFAINYDCLEALYNKEE